MVLRLPLSMLLTAAAAIALGCGGGGGDNVSDVPTLAGTPIPTAVIVPTATPVCPVDAPLPLPANIPADVPLPPDLKIMRIETTPHLIILGRTEPPPNPEANPPVTLASSMAASFRDAGWTATRNFRVDGIDYTVTHPDGRTGHFNAHLAMGCALNADLTVELFWITP